VKYPTATMTTCNANESWTQRLLYENMKPKFRNADEQDLTAVTESRVIEQDCLRTRADEPFYSSESARCLMKEALMRYCAFYRVKYMQGVI
jgi:hypothetical protein